MKVRITDLRSSEVSAAIYSHEPPEDLIESIRVNGVLAPIWVSADNIIISGHRRVEACRRLGIEEIDAEVREYSDSLVIESNRYRQKTWTERFKEAEALERIWAEKAKEKEYARKTQGTCEIFPKSIDAGKAAAKVIGISDRTLDKIKVIAAEKPELLPKIDAGELSISAAYNLVTQKTITRSGLPLLDRAVMLLEEAILLQKSGDETEDILNKMDEGKVLLEQARSLDEVEAIQDPEERLRKYIAVQSQMAYMENLAAEFRLRAERRMGELCKIISLCDRKIEKLLKEGVNA